MGPFGTIPPAKLGSLLASSPIALRNIRGSRRASGASRLKTIARFPRQDRIAHHSTRINSLFSNRQAARHATKSLTPHLSIPENFPARPSQSKGPYAVFERHRDLRRQPRRTRHASLYSTPWPREFRSPFRKSCCSKSFAPPIPLRRAGDSDRSSGKAAALPAINGLDFKSGMASIRRRPFRTSSGVKIFSSPRAIVTAERTQSSRWLPSPPTSKSPSKHLKVTAGGPKNSSPAGNACKRNNPERFVAGRRGLTFTSKSPAIRHAAA